MNEVDKIISEIQSLNFSVKEEKFDQICKVIEEANHIFVSGAGRSGLMVKAFANRLVQMKLPVSVVGEITEPKASDNDIIIFNSASGNSMTLIEQAKTAKKNGIKIILFTSNLDSKLAKLSDTSILIEAQSKFSGRSSVQPMGSLFEQYSLIVMDAISLKLSSELGVTEKEMRNNHANIE